PAVPGDVFRADLLVISRQRPLPAAVGYRYHGDRGVADPDLVAPLQPLGGDDAAVVEEGAVGRAQVLDVPQAVRGLEEAVMAGRVLVADGQCALPSGGEILVEDMGLLRTFYN